MQYCPSTDCPRKAGALSERELLRRSASVRYFFHQIVLKPAGLRRSKPQVERQGAYPKALFAKVALIAVVSYERPLEAQAGLSRRRPAPARHSLRGTAKGNACTPDFLTQEPLLVGTPNQAGTIGGRPPSYTSTSPRTRGPRQPSSGTAHAVRAGSKTPVAVLRPLLAMLLLLLLCAAAAAAGKQLSRTLFRALL